MKSNRKTDAITFAVHGSRVELSNVFIIDLIADLNSAIPANVGFLEMTEPSLAKALMTHIADGKKAIRVIPLFLAPGRHSVQDIPDVVASVVTPDCTITIDPFIGAHALFKKLLKDLL